MFSHKYSSFLDFSWSNFSIISPNFLDMIKQSTFASCLWTWRGVHSLVKEELLLCLE